MSKNLSQVYANLLLALDRRGVKVAKECQISNDEIVRKINSEDVIAITGTRGAEDPRGAAIVLCFLIPGDSKYLRTGDFRKLIQIKVRATSTAKPPTYEIIIVSEGGLSTHVRKQIEVFKTELPNVVIEEHPHKIFLMDITKHASVPEHSLADDAEVDEFCATYCLTRDRFQKILTTDPQAVWLGVRPGMVVKIVRPSETAGYAVAYRYCVRG
jgi:DNA-directed RNA polymerase subunit H (RpoH/RPB5)